MSRDSQCTEELNLGANWCISPVLVFALTLDMNRICSCGVTFLGNDRLSTLTFVESQLNGESLHVAFAPHKFSYESVGRAIPRFERNIPTSSPQSFVSRECGSVKAKISLTSLMASRLRGTLTELCPTSSSCNGDIEAPN